MIVGSQSGIQYWRQKNSAFDNGKPNKILEMNFWKLYLAYWIRNGEYNTAQQKNPLILVYSSIPIPRIETFSFCQL